MQWRLSLAARLALSFTVGPVILALIGMLAYTNTTRLLVTRDLVSHTHNVLNGTDDIALALLEMESAERGYLLTGSDSFLQMFETAAINIDKEVQEVVELAQDNPRQQARLQSLKPLLKMRTDELRDLIGMRKQQVGEAAIVSTLLGRDRKLSEDIKAVFSSMRGEERALLDQRVVEADNATRMTLNAITYGTALIFVFLAIGGLWIVRSITRPLESAVNDLATATAEIVAGTSQQASSIQEQVAAVVETVSTVDEITQTSSQANDRASAVSEASRRAVEVGDNGRRAVEDATEVMGTVEEQTEALAQRILGLAEQAQAIGEIIAAVTDIADQSNLLSLNAAIEASRAGEHGRGFSVVAAEIKALAEQSKRATAQVRQILGEIQKSTNGAVLATEEGAKSVNKALLAVRQAGATIATLSETIDDAARAAAQITASVGQQSAGMSQIQQAMHNINQGTNQTLAATRQTEQAARDLDHLGGRLRKLLAGTAS